MTKKTRKLRKGDWLTLDFDWGREGATVLLTERIPLRNGGYRDTAYIRTESGVELTIDR